MMQNKLKTYLLAAGCVGASYALFNYLFSEKVQTLPVSQTQKILQEIKHQMLIVCINFS